jgi:hypothetical protein
MSIFKDPKFENLDWLTQITETIESDANDILSALPEKIQITYEKVDEILGNSWRVQIDSDSIVRQMIRHYIDNSEKQITISFEQMSSITNCFSLEMSDEVIIDLEEKTMIGEIFLVKNIATFDDDFLQKTMGQNGISRYISTISFSASASRLNHVLELLGYSGADMRTKSIKTKKRQLITTLTKIFKNNEWRVRDTALADRACRWIKLYAEDGNLAAFNNFCRLKVMTHSGGPIYSIGEEEAV